MLVFFPVKNEYHLSSLFPRFFHEFEYAFCLHYVEILHFLLLKIHFYPVMLFLLFQNLTFDFLECLRDVHEERPLFF